MNMDSCTEIQRNVNNDISLNILCGIKRNKYMFIQGKTPYDLAIFAHRRNKGNKHYSGEFKLVFEYLKVYNTCKTLLKFSY